MKVHAGLHTPVFLPSGGTNTRVMLWFLGLVFPSPFGSKFFSGPFSYWCFSAGHTRLWVTGSRHRCKLNTRVSLCPSGWNKTSLSHEASEEPDGYSSAEDPLNSDTEEDNSKNLVSFCAQWALQPLHNNPHPTLRIRFWILPNFRAQYATNILISIIYSIIHHIKNISLSILTKDV